MYESLATLPLMEKHTRPWFAALDENPRLVEYIEDTVLPQFDLIEAEIFGPQALNEVNLEGIMSGVGILAADKIGVPDMAENLIDIVADKFGGEDSKIVKGLVTIAKDVIGVLKENPVLFAVATGILSQFLDWGNVGGIIMAILVGLLLLKWFKKSGGDEEKVKRGAEKIEQVAKKETALQKDIKKGIEKSDVVKKAKAKKGQEKQQDSSPFADKEAQGAGLL